MKRKHLSLIALLLTITFAIAFSTTAAYACKADDEDDELLEIVLNNAHSADFDGDGFMDDIVVKGYVICEPGAKVKVYFVLSGRNNGPVTTRRYIIPCDHKLTRYKLQLHDTISEPGWYVIQAFASWKDQNAVSNPFVFDPGGGTQGPLMR